MTPYVLFLILSATPPTAGFNMSNSDWLAVIAILNGIYVTQNFLQNKKINEMVKEFKQFLHDLTVLQTEHEKNHPKDVDNEHIHKRGH